MAEITVRRVETKADLKTYFEYPYYLYADSPYWTPPLKSMRKHEMDREHGASWAYMDGEFFIAEKNGETVGIIAAFINHRHNSTWNENISWFGDFHFVDDPAVCKALLATAEEFAKSKGCDALRGPVTFNLHGEPGVRIGAHDTPNVILLPYNYEYYGGHIEAAGYHKEMDLLNWRSDSRNLNDDTNPHFVKLQRIVERNNKRRNIEVRLGNRKEMHKDFELIRELYNTAWADNWGFVPLNDSELDQMIKDLKDFYEPSMTFYAYVDGKQAGFLLAVPDMNEAILKARPQPRTPEIITLLRILWYWKIKKVIKGVRIPLMGVKREYHQIGVDGALLLTAMTDGRKMTQFERFDGGWTLETNQPVNQINENLQAELYCRFRIYQKELVG